MDPILEQEVPPQTQPGRSHWRIILLLALAVHIAVATAFFRFSQGRPLAVWAQENIAIALSLHAGHGFSSPYFTPSGPTAFMTPGYPLLLAGIIWIFGTGAFAFISMLAIQLFFSILTIAVVMYVAQSHFGVRTANLAGFLCVVSFPMLMAPLWIWDTCLSALLLVVLFAVAPVLHRGRMRFIAAGIGCALAALVNPSLIPSLLAICAWAAWQAGKIPWAGILAFLIVFSPWPLRNMAVMHSFVPFRSNFGYELWMGNHPGGNGDTDPSINLMKNLGEQRAFVSQGEIAYMREKGSLAKTYIRRHPGVFLRLSLKRILRFWMGTVGGEGASAALLSLLAGAGLLLLWRRRPLFLLYALPLLLYPLPYYITHADVRFQYVIDPLLAILAAHAIEAFLLLIKSASE